MTAAARDSADDPTDASAAPGADAAKTVAVKKASAAGSAAKTTSAKRAAAANAAKTAAVKKATATKAAEKTASKTKTAGQTAAKTAAVKDAAAKAAAGSDETATGKGKTSPAAKGTKAPTKTTKSGGATKRPAATKSAGTKTKSSAGSASRSGSRSPSKSGAKPADAAQKTTAAAVAGVSAQGSAPQAAEVGEPRRVKEPDTPVEEVALLEATEPVESSEPLALVEPVEPVEPAKSAEVTEPAQSAEVTETAESAEQAEEPTASDPVEPTASESDPTAVPESGAGTASDPVEPTASESDALAAIRIRGLVKRFGDVRAVDDVDLTVPAGSFYGLVGPNGAGKTTTLSIISGLLRPDAGTVHISGIDQREDPLAAKRVMGVLPDRLRTFDRLTGRQLLYYYGQLRGLDRAVIEKRTADLARAFDLSEALSRVVSDYSAGMTKKLMLAGALIHSPRVLVLDEPFEAVDPVSSGVILDILRSYVSHGGTVILSSHGMDLIERVCSRVAVIVDGEVLAEGTIDEVRAGQSLTARFVELSGAGGEVEGLEWLHTFSD